MASKTHKRLLAYILDRKPDVHFFHKIAGSKYTLTIVLLNILLYIQSTLISPDSLANKYSILLPNIKLKA